MNPAEVRQALDRLTMFGIKLGLEQTRLLFERSGAPLDLNYIHIAGTNGKGSVGAMLEAALRHCGFRTGFYSSPHLIDVRERFRINGRAVDEPTLARAFEQVDTAAESMRKEGASPTFFEVTTAMAARIFQEAKTDFVIWETGMGGRMDATSVVTPLVNIITNIAMDHEQYLGNTLAGIAAEKAGILREGVPLFTGFLAEEARKVIAAEAEKHHWPVTGPESMPETEVHYARDERGLYQTIRCGTKEIRLHLPGAMQRRNFCTVLPVLRHLAQKFAFPLDKALDGISLAKWPGRCQCVKDGLIVDGGHNPDGAAALQQAMQETCPGQKFAVVFAGFADKDVAENLRLLSPLAEHWFFTPMESERPSLTPENLAEMAAAAGSNTSFTAAENSREAVELAGKSGLPVLAAGSLYLAGEVLREQAPETVFDLV
ncbi:MAG: bifunctional folylpolyglutamate synthase/dihydrofolate synthase [Lentisphaeria bacterium]|nr:bifunctional folylpolyglutamate synthase/dihydrofolate synthase [Lentisphaeria bacterium]